MSRYKVLYSLNNARLAGTEKHVLLLVKNLNRDLFDPSVVFFSTGPLIDIFRKEGVQTHCLNRRSTFDFKAARESFSLLKQNHFDILHSHCGQFFCFLSKLAGTPWTIETRHGLILNYKQLESVNPLQYLVNRGKARLVDLTLTVCESDKRVLQEKFGIPATKIRKVVNGIDVDWVDGIGSGKHKLRRELNLSGSTQIVGTIARFTAQKGLEHFIRAIHILRELAPKTHFVIVGDGGLRESLGNLAKDMGLSEILTFAGYRQDAVELMSSFDVFVLPSLWEGLPYTILEAMALSKPVVATNVFGNAEVVVDAETGYLVPAEDEAALAQAVNKLLSNPALARKMGRRGNKRVKDLFSAQFMTRQLEETYLELLNG